MTRRGSVVGPLILILIGVLFLLRNLWSQFPIVDIISMYWPFLLIGWGVLRLVEILFWSMRGKPLPVNGVSGGEWVLVIFLCIFGSGLYAARHSPWFPNGRIQIGGLEVFGEAYDYPIAAQQAVGKANRLTIESFRGNARITGGDVTEVKVTGRKTIRALQQKQANESDQQSPFELVANGNQIIVRTNQDRSTGSARISEDLEITIPKAMSVEAVGRYGDFDITDVNGSVDIVSDNAGVRLQNIGGNVRIDTRRSDVVRVVSAKGTVDLKGRGNDLELQDIGGQVVVSAMYGGTVEFRNLAKPVRYDSGPTQFNAEAVPGDVRLTLSDFTASNLVGPVRLQARSKDVNINGFTQGLELSLDRGDIQVRPGGPTVPKIDVRTHSGDIDLALPDKAKVQLEATTERGEVTNDYNDALTSQSQGPGASMKGSLGDGPRVVLATNRGSITVRKASELSADVAPAAPPRPAAPPKPLQPIEQ